MIEDKMAGSLYLLLAAMLVLGGLMSRRTRFSQLLIMLLAWIAIFGAGFVLFTFRDDLGLVAQRLRAEALGTPVKVGPQIRVPMAIDGHFWIDATVNGIGTRFLVDSGATVTTISRDLAQRANVTVEADRNQLVRTGNGLIRVAAGRARELRAGTIERHDVAVHVADGEDFNVLGMSFLSTLRRWGVEGRWLILEP